MPNAPQPSHNLPFNPVVAGAAPSLDERLDELIRWGKTFHRMGLAPSYGTGSHGNLSVRKNQGCLITATQTFLGELSEAHFVEIEACDLSVSPPAVQYRGALRPSTDSLIHWALYRLRPEVNCVLHAHDALVLRCADRLKLPQTEREADAGSPGLLELIQPFAHEPYFLIRGHGFVSAGRTIDEAGQLALSIHEKAKALDASS